MFKTTLHPALLPCLVVMDMACVASTGHQITTELVKIAHSRMQEAKGIMADEQKLSSGSGSAVDDEAEVQGATGLLDKIMQWRQLSMQLHKSTDSSEDTLEVLSRFYHTNLQRGLVQLTQPLDSRHLAALAQCHHDMDAALRRAEGSFAEYADMMRRHVELGDTEAIKPVIRIAMRNVLFMFDRHLPKCGQINYLLE